MGLGGLLSALSGASSLVGRALTTSALTTGILGSAVTLPAACTSIAGLG